MFTSRTAPLPLLVAATLAACTIRIPATTDDTTGDTGDPPNSDTSAPALTTGDGEPGTTGGAALETGTTTDVSTGAGGSTTTIPDLWPQRCDIWAQDCPAGQKCSPHTVPDGWFGDTWCVPVADDPDQVGEPCLRIDGDYSGRDTCEAGAFCWDYFLAGGVCMALCTGSSASPLCPDMHACTIFVDDVLPLCLDGCHPLTQDCPPGQLCAPVLQNLDFMCVPAMPAEEGGAHAPCEAGNTCDPGFFCTYKTAAVECDSPTSRCCEPFCDLDAANTCPGQGQVCAPWYPEGAAPEGFEQIGTCVAPG